MELDIRLAARACSNFAILRFRIAEIGKIALTHAPGATPGLARRTDRTPHGAPTPIALASAPRPVGVGVRQRELHRHDRAGDRFHRNGGHRPPLPAPPGDLDARAAPVGRITACKKHVKRSDATRCLASSALTPAGQLGPEWCLSYFCTATAAGLLGVLAVYETFGLAAMYAVILAR
jgi:hypothetical protein